MEELAADYAAGQLIWIERWRYRAHLAACRVCRRQRKPDAIDVPVPRPSADAAGSQSGEEKI